MGTSLTRKIPKWRHGMALVALAVSLWLLPKHPSCEASERCVEDGRARKEMFFFFFFLFDYSEWIGTLDDSSSADIKAQGFRLLMKQDYRKAPSFRRDSVL